MPFIERDGARIHFEQLFGPSESAETLLFIPGLSANTCSFPSLFDALRTRYTLVSFDPRGAGRTEYSGRFRLNDIADDAAAVLDHLGIESTRVLGLSMGGMIAQELALAHAARVSDLVLCCTMCGQRPGRRPGPVVIGRLLRGILTARGGKRTVEAVADRFGSLLFADDTPREIRIEFFRPRTGSNAPTRTGLISQLLAVQRFGTYQRLGSLRHRTLVIHGTEDVLVPVQNADVLNSAIPNSELALLPGGHVFFHEHPDLFLTTIFRFFDGHEC